MEMPHFKTEKETDTSTEEKKLTQKHLKIIKKFTGVLEKLVEGLLLTGSTAWGAYYAITPSSDIDLLVIINNLNQLDKVIETLVNAKLISFKERERLRIFKQLYNQGKADQFSLITSNSGVPVSIDFLFPDTLKKIVSLSKMKNRDYEGIKIRVVNEFRTNTPRTTGYSLDGLKKQGKVIYHPKFKKIKNNQDVIIGYLSETLVDGQTSQEEEINYFLGVMSFFLSINPLVLVDKDKKLANQIRTLQLNIAGIMGDQIPAYITRQERMTEDCLNKIKESLTKKGSIIR